MFSSQSLEFYGLKTAPIMRAEPADLPQIKIDERRMDFVFYLVDDTYLHIEFQTTFKKEDLDRFKLYDALLYEEKKKPVYKAIIYGAGIDNSPTVLNHGSLLRLVGDQRNISKHLAPNKIGQKGKEANKIKSFLKPRQLIYRVEGLWKKQKPAFPGGLDKPKAILLPGRYVIK